MFLSYSLKTIQAILLNIGEIQGSVDKVILTGEAPLISAMYVREQMLSAFCFLPLKQQDPNLL